MIHELDRLRFASTSPRQIRLAAVALGIAWTLAFAIVGIGFRLQMYGDGAAFSFAIALGESWSMHWHNIVCRLSVYVLCLLPAEVSGYLSHDAIVAATVYGALFFGAQGAGLVATRLCDRSPPHAIFAFACASTCVCCPLTFGFPTEMWIAHALFWPALALAHHAQRGTGGHLAVMVAFLLLVFTHEGALVLALAIVGTTLLHGAGSSQLLRAATAFSVALVIWFAARLSLPPDAYFAPVLARAAANFFDPEIFTTGTIPLLALSLVAFSVLSILLRRLGPLVAAGLAGVAVVALLTIYWHEFAPALQAERRYYLRTAMVVLVPAFGALAALFAVPACSDAGAIGRCARRLREALARPFVVNWALAAMLLVTVVHAFEATRFVAAWAAYTTEVGQLASSAGPRDGTGFVSSTAIDKTLQQLGWSSTVPFLSVLLAPNLNPARLVVDPAAGYFWMTCALSRRSEAAKGTIPQGALRLIRAYSCMHRRS